MTEKRTKVWVKATQVNNPFDIDPEHKNNVILELNHHTLQGLPKLTRLVVPLTSIQGSSK